MRTYARMIVALVGATLLLQCPTVTAVAQKEAAPAGADALEALPASRSGGRSGRPACRYHPAARKPLTGVPTGPGRPEVRLPPLRRSP